jgi:signal-transduction protein with cAMP-binding, CBS, and nucleotidyltransferase domain
MPTDYNSADFSQLYRQFKQQGRVDDLKRLAGLLSFPDNQIFFATLDEHLEQLDRGCRLLEERRDYLKVRQAEVVRLSERVRSSSSLDELVELHRRLNVIAVELYLKGLGVMEIHALITNYRHQLTRRVLELICRELGPLPCKFAWFNMGSDGRREQTFFTDQDNALVYATDGSQAVDDFFAGFAERVVSALDKVGFALCKGRIMPSNPDWRGSVEEWRRMLDKIFHDQSQENLLRVIILMDIAFSTGDEALGRQFSERVHQMIQDNFGALMVMARSAVMSSVALTMFRNFRLEKSGEHEGMFNVKLYGWAPLIMTTRVFALKYAYTDTNTVARIRHLEAGGHFEADFSRQLQEAYLVLANAKFISQVEAVVSGREYDYYLNPESLSEAEQDRLKQALITVEALQKLAYNSFFGGGGM